MATDLLPDNCTLEEEKSLAEIESGSIINKRLNDMLVRSHNVFPNIRNLLGIAAKIRNHKHGIPQMVPHQMHTVGMVNDNHMVKSSRLLPRRLAPQKLQQLLLHISILIPPKLTKLRFALPFPHQLTVIRLSILIVAQRSKERNKDDISRPPIAHSKCCALILPICHVGCQQIRS